MSKTGAWYLDMQEDAGNLTKDEFIKKHGEHNLDLWTEVHEELGDLEEMQKQLNEMDINKEDKPMVDEPIEMEEEDMPEEKPKGLMGRRK